MTTCVRSTGWDLPAFSFLDEREVLLFAFSDSTSARELRLSEAVSSPLLPPSLPACKKAMPGGQDIVLSSIMEVKRSLLWSGGYTQSSFKPFHPHSVGVSWVTEGGKVESLSWGRWSRLGGNRPAAAAAVCRESGFCWQQPCLSPTIRLLATSKSALGLCLLRHSGAAASGKERSYIRGPS